MFIATITNKEPSSVRSAMSTFRPSGASSRSVAITINIALLTELLLPAPCFLLPASCLLFHIVCQASQLVFGFIASVFKPLVKSAKIPESLDKWLIFGQAAFGTRLVVNPEGKAKQSWRRREGGQR